MHFFSRFKNLKYYLTTQYVQYPYQIKITFQPQVLVYFVAYCFKVVALHANK